MILHHGTLNELHTKHKSIVEPTRLGYSVSITDSLSTVASICHAETFTAAIVRIHFPTTKHTHTHMTAINHSRVRQRALLPRT